MIISLEGPDMSGKSTQAEKMRGYYKMRGLESVVIHFPTSTTFFGKQIKRILNKEEDYPGDFIMQSLFVLDQALMKDEIERLDNEGYHVILDRYDFSTLAYLDDERLMPIITSMQKNVKNPDITLFFNTKGKSYDRPGIKDLFEENTKKISKINDKYLSLLDFCKSLAYKRQYKVIDATKTEDEVHEEIMSYIINKVDYKFIK